MWPKLSSTNLMPTLRTKPLAIIACGDRNWTNRDLIEETLTDYGPSVVIEGDARGADKLSGWVAEEDLDLVRGETHIVMPADWKKMGRAAGPIRNTAMLMKLIEYREYRGFEVAVVAFHNDIKNSKGTKNMIKQAEREGINVEVVSE